MFYGVFHSAKTSGLNFRQFPLANGTAAFSKISKKEDNLARYTQISNFFSRNFSSIKFCSQSFYNCFVEEWFAFRKLKKLSGEIAVLFASVSKFLKVLVEWNAPSVLQFDWDERQLCPFFLHISHAYSCCHP